MTAQIALLYILPALEAVVIVALILMLRRERRAAMEFYQHTLDENKRRKARFTPPSKQQIDEYRKRYPDYRNISSPNPPPSVVAKYQTPEKE
ncbi:hypothetical protein AXY1_19 [Achromobacter phage AXY1]|nr:hypothetical protein AXY1_19 [Achromobacter phage AXY1]